MKWLAPARVDFEMVPEGCSAILYMAPSQPVPPGKLTYDLWHLSFVNLVQQRAPPNFEVQSEVRLSLEPQRADILLLRRVSEARRDGDAQVLRAIWPWLARVTIVEFKSPVRSSFRPGDLVRLWSYGGQYQAAHMDDLPTRADLTLLLVIPSLTPTLRGEIDRMGWTLVPLGRGYSRIDGAVYTLFVAVTDEVTLAEKDDFLGMFSHHPVTNSAVNWWFRSWTKETTVKQKIKDIPGYDEMREKLFDCWSPEERLAGLAPEERLAGLAPEQVVLALPVEMLRVLPDDYLRSLPPDIEQTIRHRIARADD
jgi:hypothetical protein